MGGRMDSGMAEAAREARGHEAVCVSHQLAIWVARRSAEERRLWHHPGRRECALGSVTSFTYAGDTITGVSYAEPADGGRGGGHGARAFPPPARGGPGGRPPRPPRPGPPTGGPGPEPAGGAPG